MAKKSKGDVSISAPAPLGPVVINPFGPTEQRKITRSKIVESIITLSDGTKLLIKPVVGDIRRAIDQYNQNGEPIYFLALGQTITTKAPKHLMRKSPQEPKTAKKTKRISMRGRR